jgi:hypothetical protein
VQKIAQILEPALQQADHGRLRPAQVLAGLSQMNAPRGLGRDSRA